MPENVDWDAKNQINKKKTTHNLSLDVFAQFTAKHTLWQGQGTLNNKLRMQVSSSNYESSILHLLKLKRICFPFLAERKCFNILADPSGQ